LLMVCTSRRFWWSLMCVTFWWRWSYIWIRNRPLLLLHEWLELGVWLGYLVR